MRQAACEGEVTAMADDFPDLPIIDAHLHLTDPARLRYPWMEGVPKLNRPWSLADFDALSGGVPVAGMVFVEVDAHPDDKLAEADFVAGLGDPRLLGMVAAVPMDRGEATAAALAAMRERPLLRGVRHLIQHHAATPGWACRPEMIEGVRTLAPLGLAFDLCLYHPQIRDATALVAACPEVTFVLDHIGKPGIRAGLIDDWRADLSALARLPNVLCKVSGVATEAEHAAWTEDQLLPYLTHAMNVFGADRVLYGGDWFVSELAIAYPRWVALVHRAALPFGSAFAEGLWHRNARAVYRLPPATVRQ
jgi:L-fuconolactonase